MRKFLIGAAIYAVLLCSWGTALEIDKAEAGYKWVYCAPKAGKSIPYPHIWGTTKRCYNPGWWVRIWKPKTYAATPARVCVDWKPKVTKQIGRGEASSSWVPRRACVKGAFR